ncbi:ATP-binding cassette domain-containing protein [Virgibacillus doumboii]|uniref:ATP-binding cassette domain-containing protein n=1 Tax=Virgibacillus doumboii TaxID=2697503 RepID=UPI0013DF041D|nr:ABC transporter ATP-binding protein [Virgibacillus doumboii]
MQAYANISQVQKKVDDFHLGPIDLKITPGTITALVGNNGSGKSTLLKLMMNMVSPDMGNIKVFDKFVYGQDESWKTKISFQPQTAIGFNGYTGKELKALISLLYPDWDESLFEKMMEAFNLPLTKKYGKLSQGVQQKLTLALTIPRNTPLLLLDEPTAFMDIPSKRLLMDILTDWMDQGGPRAIVMASHQTEDIMKLADYLCVLQDGKMNGVFEKDALTESYKRYWLSSSLPETTIPGEVARKTQQIISNQPEQTEAFFEESNTAVTNRTSLDMEEIIELILS